jgi:predicted transcriptional regulator
MLHQTRLQVDLSEQSLPVFDALASPVRLSILRKLNQAPANVQQLASYLGLSSAIVTMHVRKLEDARLIRCASLSGRRGRQKLCSFELESLICDLPPLAAARRIAHEFSLPVGHYTNIAAKPTCGLATIEKTIGIFDDVRAFLNPERVDAAILWFGEGYVEYTLPNYLTPGREIDELLISLELGSEYPANRSDWPSEITFTINNVKLGNWISPGDFADRRGTYTPSWWVDHVNQYGQLKMLSIRRDGTYINSQRISDVTVTDLGLNDMQYTFRISVEPDACPVGGLTIYGKGFGDYDQDIKVTMFEQPD